MFGGLGVVFLALLILPVLGGIAAGMLFLSIPRLRFLAAYSALLPLFGLLGLIGGFIGGMRLSRPYLYRYDYGLSTIVWPAWAHHRGDARRYSGGHRFGSTCRTRDQPIGSTTRFTTSSAIYTFVAAETPPALSETPVYSR